MAIVPSIRPEVFCKICHDRLILAAIFNHLVPVGRAGENGIQ